MVIQFERLHSVYNARGNSSKGGNTSNFMVHNQTKFKDCSFRNNHSLDFLIKNFTGLSSLTMYFLFSSELQQQNNGISLETGHYLAEEGTGSKRGESQIVCTKKMRISNFLNSQLALKLEVGQQFHQTPSHIYYK